MARREVPAHAGSAARLSGAATKRRTAWSSEPNRMSDMIVSAAWRSSKVKGFRNLTPWHMAEAGVRPACGPYSLDSEQVAFMTFAFAPRQFAAALGGVGYRLGGAVPLLLPAPREACRSRRAVVAAAAAGAAGSTPKSLSSCPKGAAALGQAPVPTFATQLRSWLELSSSSTEAAQEQARSSRSTDSFACA